jgi:hypothetical protein
MDALEVVVFLTAIAAFYALMCAGEVIAKWLMGRFDRIAAWFTEPDPDDDELVEWVRDLGDGGHS